MGVEENGPVGRTGYNRVLEAFVDETGEVLDLTGLVAYALYKRHKRDWIVEYKAANDGRVPSQAETEAVTSSYLTQELRNTLRQRASDLLSNYGSAYVEALTPVIREDAISSETLRQARSIQQSIEAKSGFRMAVWTGIVSTALWTLLVAILAAAIGGPEFFHAIATALSS